MVHGIGGRGVEERCCELEMFGPIIHVMLIDIFPCGRHPVESIQLLLGLEL